MAQAAVNSAQRQVAELHREPINEVRALSTPPPAVARALAVVHGVLFGREARAAPPRWPALQKMLRGDDFLPRVRGFRVKGSALADAAVVARLRRELSGEGGAEGALTEAAVQRASQAVAALFGWARVQLALAELQAKMQGAEEEAAKAGAPPSGLGLGGHLDAAEAARARLAAVALNCQLQKAVERNGLGTRVAMVEAIHSADTGPREVEALERQLQGAEALLEELQEQRDAMTREVDSAKRRLKESSHEVAELEVQLLDASVVRAGPPLCDCGEEMVHREVANLADPNWGRKYWKCPRRQGGCDRREWDDSAPVTDLTEAKLGG